VISVVFCFDRYDECDRCDGIVGYRRRHGWWEALGVFDLFALDLATALLC
jgi:hypothetical protein